MLASPGRSVSLRYRDAEDILALARARRQLSGVEAILGHAHALDSCFLRSVHQCTQFAIAVHAFLRTSECR